jgi:hypothetical protein
MNIHLHDNSAGPRETQILGLIREQRLEGTMSYHYERPKGYAAFASTQGRRFRLIEAEEAGSLLGFTQITWDEVSWNGMPLQVAYSGDTRVSLQARGKRVSDRLIHAACTLPDPVWGAVFDSNEVVLKRKLDHWRAQTVNFSVCAGLDALFFRPGGSPKIGEGLTIRRATPEDAESMFVLWRRYANDHDLTRYYDSPESFASDLPPGTSLETTLLVEQQGSLLAMMGLWNQDELRKIQVDTRSRLLNWVPKFMLDLPRAGEELRILYSYRHAWLESHPRCATAIALLVQEARRISGQHKRHLFCIGIDSRDPMNPVVRQGALFTNRARVICDPRGRQEMVFGTRPLHLEVALG